MTDESLSAAERVAILNLLAIEGIGSATVIRLVQEIGSGQGVFEASEKKLSAIPRMSAQMITRIKAVKADDSKGKRQFLQAVETGVRVLTFWDNEYPPMLRELEADAPVVLFVRGQFASKAERLGAVGTRTATAYGKRMTRDLILGLSGSGVEIVSGLASGIDGYAHEAALEAGLITVAVFGCGVDRIYPPLHGALANRILANGGALISEYPLGTGPDRHHFPQRNRIIAGICRGVLVVEAGDRSGALITAHLALEYNREVMAVPGSVTNPKTSGCHRLIKAGAALIERAEDILEIFHMNPADAASAESKQAALDLKGPESDLYNALDPSVAAHIDDIAQKLNMPVGEALGYLLLMELKGAVKQLPGKYFVRA
ncbi:DNA-protecting protein DprA [candidate division KSB1 bacterium]|nr:MAG: DNA-protecting protein DprA [candidate division KSB1 bacterium]